jgi:DNA-binding transcriptional MerR regulator
MGFTLEEINMMLELLTVEQCKQTVRNNESIIEKYETIKQKLHALTRNFRS